MATLKTITGIFPRLTRPVGLPRFRKAKGGNAISFRRARLAEEVGRGGTIRPQFGPTWGGQRARASQTHVVPKLPDASSKSSLGPLRKFPNAQQRRAVEKA